jgi:chromosome segregation ATPase
MSLWEKMRSDASRAADVAQKQATSTRLSMQIDDAKTEIRRKTAELGKLALELVRKGELTDPALQSLSHDIAALETQIADLQAQIADLKGGTSRSDTTRDQASE